MDGQNLRGYIIFRCLVFIGFVSAIIQIKGDIEVIYDFHVTFDNNV